MQCFIYLYGFFLNPITLTFWIKLFFLIKFLIFFSFFPLPIISKIKFKLYLFFKILTDLSKVWWSFWSVNLPIFNILNLFFFLKNLKLISFLDLYKISFLFNGLYIHVVLTLNFFLNSFWNSRLFTIILSALANIFLKIKFLILFWVHPEGEEFDLVTILTLKILQTTMQYILAWKAKTSGFSLFKISLISIKRQIKCKIPLHKCIGYDNSIPYYSLPNIYRRNSK